MKALVTGATGFIGSHLTDLLLSRGFEVRCMIRKTSNLRWLDGKPVELVEASLGNFEALKKAVQNVDYVFHVAGLTAARDYSEFLRANRDGTSNLIKAVYENNPNLKRFIYVSSQTVCGPAQSLDKPTDEYDECHPITSYGKSKREAEKIVISYMDKLPITIIRPPAVYGPRDEDILDVFKTVKSGLGTMVGLKPKYISLIHSTDLVRGIADAGVSENTIGKIYFVTSEEIYNWPQLIKIIKAALDKHFVINLRIPHFLVLTVAGISGFIGKFQKNPPVFNYEKGIDFIQKYWICSPARAQKDFGYHQMTSAEEGMNITAKWYKENNWL